jgi:hypothetical protein
MVALAMAVTIAIAITNSIAVANSVAVADVLPIAVAIAIGHCCCGLRQPLPLPSLLHCRQPSPLPFALAIGHCCFHHHWPLQLPSLSAITVTIAITHCQELLPWCSKNCIQTIQAKNAYLILFCLDSGRCTDQSRMTDQVLSSDGRHQRWAASGKQ